MKLSYHTNLQTAEPSAVFLAEIHKAGAQKSVIVFLKERKAQWSLTPLTGIVTALLKHHGL